MGDGGDASQKGESLGGEELAREDSGDDGETADGGQRQEAEESSGDDGETADGGQRQVAEESRTALLRHLPLQWRFR